MPVMDLKVPDSSPALVRAVSAAERAVDSTRESISQCGLFDTALGTKAALNAQMRLEQKRLSLLAGQQAGATDPSGNTKAIGEIHHALTGEQTIVNEAMSSAVSKANIAYTSARLVNEVGTASVEVATTAIAGPAVGATVGMGIRTASNVGQTIVEKQIGSETHFSERLASDAAGAAIGFVGGKAGQSAAAALHATGQKVISTVGASVAGGVTLTAFNTGHEVMLRASNGEQLLQSGDLKRWGVNATASSAAWALGDHSGKYAESLTPLAKSVVSAAGATAIAVTAEYANTGEVSASTLSRGISSTFGSAAAGHHLASRNYQVAPITGVNGHIPKDVTPEGYKALSLRSEGAGVVSIHLENVGALMKGEVTVPTIRKEFASLMKVAEANPDIQQVRVSSPLLARMSPDGGSATLRPLGEALMREHGGVPQTPTLTPDLQKVGITALETLKAIPQMNLRDPIRNLGQHEYTAGFDVSVKDINYNFDKTK